MIASQRVALRGLLLGVSGRLNYSQLHTKPRAQRPFYAHTGIRRFAFCRTRKAICEETCGRQSASKRPTLLRRTRAYHTGGDSVAAAKGFVPCRRMNVTGASILSPMATEVPPNRNWHL